MTDNFNVGYSVDALGDLREIYSYIANELLVLCIILSMIKRGQLQWHEYSTVVEISKAL